MHGIRPPRSILSAPILSRTGVGALIAVLALGVSSCGSSEPDERSLPDLLLTSDMLPAQFTPAPMMIGDLVGANRRALEGARSLEFSPRQCAPTADAEFNPHVTEDNSALVVGRSDDGRVSELISTVPYDVDADRRASLGPCATVTAVAKGGGIVDGSRIVTTARELPAVRDDAVTQSFLVRTQSITTFVDGGRRGRTMLKATLLVQRPDRDPITVQLIVSGDSSAIDEGAGAPPAPVSDDEFSDLVREAVARASR